jgi:hypothetical protein
MSGIDVAYLGLILAAFGVFTVALAWATYQGSRR